MEEHMTPTRGLCLVKRVEVDNKLGLIYAPDDVVDKWTAQQVEIVACGKPELYEEIPDRLETKPGWNKTVKNGKVYYYRPVPYLPNDWLLIQPRVLCPTGVPDLYMIRYDNIMGVFKE